jgi:hypothetical protein
MWWIITYPLTILGLGIAYIIDATIKKHDDVFPPPSKSHTFIMGPGMTMSSNTINATSTNYPVTFTWPNGTNTTVAMPLAGQWSWTYNSNTVALTHTASSTTVHVDGPGVEDIPPAEKEDMPILAQRYAGLTLAKGDVIFQSVNPQFGGFRIDADAECYGKNNIHPDDPAPYWNCLCGFYAVPADMLPKHQEYRSQLALLVELSGEVIQCSEGYRAGHQRVLEAYVQPCRTCGKPSNILWIGTESKALKFADCGTHVYRQGVHAINKKINGRWRDLGWKPDGNVETEILAGISLSEMSSMAGIPFKPYRT